MPELSASTAVMAALVFVAADALLLARRPRNIVVTYVQLLFSITAIGATLLAEETADAAVILLLGLATKILLQATYRFFSPTLASLARVEPLGPAPIGFYALLTTILVGCYAALIAGGGFSWYESGDFRLDYMAGNSVTLRAVRHVTPVMIVWGLAILKQLLAESRASARFWDRVLVGGLLALQVCAFALLEGSKGAAVVILVLSAGAAQLLGYRVRKRVLLAFGAVAGLLLTFFLLKVADEWSTSALEAFGMRMVSGSEGLLRAVVPPNGIHCPVDTFWYPITNFFSKLAGYPQQAGYNSMGHCLTGMPPDYGWELLVPLLAGAYHGTQGSVVPFAIGFAALAVSALTLTWWTASVVRLPQLAFPASYFVFLQLLIVATDGKLANFVVSPLASTLAFILFSAALNWILLRGSREALPPPEHASAVREAGARS